MINDENPPSQKPKPQKPTAWAPRCMSILEFCTWACVSRSYAYSEIAAGRLRVTKLGRSTRILIEDAEAWLKSRPQFKPKGAGGKKPEPETDRDDDIAA